MHTFIHTHTHTHINTPTHTLTHIHIKSAKGKDTKQQIGRTKKLQDTLSAITEVQKVISSLKKRVEKGDSSDTVDDVMRNLAAS